MPYDFIGMLFTTTALCEPITYAARILSHAPPYSWSIYLFIYLHNPVEKQLFVLQVSAVSKH